MVGGGSPTALHGNTMSFIQGVVTVPLKVRILAGAKKQHIYTTLLVLLTKKPLSTVKKIK